MATVNDYNVREKIQWCAGCGNFAINTALKGALAELNLPNHKVVMVSGIGC